MFSAVVAAVLAVAVAAVAFAATAPVVTTSAGATAYSEGASSTPIDPSVTVADPDSASLRSATVRISSGFQAGDELRYTLQGGIVASYSASTGVLSLSGSASPAAYQAFLRAVRYKSGSNHVPLPQKTVEFRVSDGALTSAPATKQLQITGVNDAPSVATSTTRASYTAGTAPIQADPSVTVSDPDDSQLSGATIAIGAGRSAGDGLALAPQPGITSSFNPSNGSLTLSGSASTATYRTALRAVTFSTSKATASTATRTLSFRVKDPRAAWSNIATRLVDVRPSADPLDAAVTRAFEFAAAQLTRTQALTPTSAYPLKTASDGTWLNYSFGWWTTGFFPGSLWLMHEATGDASWRNSAQSRQTVLEPQKTNTGTHDLGFLIFNSYGNGYRLTRTTAYRDVALTAAQSLASRYSATVGATRSWNNPSGASATDFRVVVDNMMNLELMFWAAKNGGDPALATKALQHAVTTAREHVRADGTTHHLVIFDSTTGGVKSKQTVQGYSNSSTWARGQAWAIHGFTMAYRETRDARMLTAARRVADWYVGHLPADKVPYWDFNAPGIPNEPRDSSAAAVAASGLLELSRLETDATRAQTYRATAKATLTSLTSPAYLAKGTSSHAILLHGTANKPGGDYDRGLIYGDYYLLEALLRYRALA